MNENIPGPWEPSHTVILFVRSALHNNQSKLHHPGRNMLLESSNKPYSVNRKLVLSAVITIATYSKLLSANSEFIMAKCPLVNVATQNSYDYNGKMQNPDHDMSTDPGP